MRVEVNGEWISTENTTLEALLGELEISKEGVAVAVGMEIIATTLWATHTINEGDEITIIRATKGG